MLTTNPHVLIEMTGEPDCRMVASWLIGAAEAQTFWSEALRDPYFKSWVFAMCDWATPHLECAALEILSALKQQDHVLSVDLDECESGIFSTEFAMMVHLGFFAHAGLSYQMTVPDSVTLESVQQAALRVTSTAKDVRGLLIIWPERVLHTVPQTQAEAWRSSRIQMRRFMADASFDQMRSIGSAARLWLSNAGFRIWMNCRSEPGA
jgi:hypothetical protein